MEEIKIYLEPNRKSEISEEIDFDKVKAGENTKKSIFIENVIKFPIDMEISLEGNNISITKNIEAIQPGAIEEVTFEFTPEITLMKPITAKLKIKLDYVIR